MPGGRRVRGSPRPLRTAVVHPWSLQSGGRKEGPTDVLAGRFLVINEPQHLLIHSSVSLGSCLLRAHSCTLPIFLLGFQFFSSWLAGVL